MSERYFNRFIKFSELCVYKNGSIVDSSGILCLFEDDEILTLTRLMHDHSEHYYANFSELEQKIWRTLVGVLERVELFNLRTLSTEVMDAKYLSDTKLQVCIKMKNDSRSINQFKLTSPNTYDKLRRIL